MEIELRLARLTILDEMEGIIKQELNMLREMISLLSELGMTPVRLHNMHINFKVLEKLIEEHNKNANELIDLITPILKEKTARERDEPTRPTN